jgi:DNA-binding transcriptional LysR family regulator
MDTTRVLNIFLNVARAQSFSQAAHDTGLTTPAVSRAIAQLEERLGVRLLHRTTRRVSLTDEGARLFELADSALRLLDEAMDKTVYATQQTGGMIRIAAPRSLGVKLLVPVLAAFQDKRPDIHFDVMLDDHFTDLAANKIDVGFRAGSAPERNVISRSLGAMSLVVCASNQYVTRHGLPRSAEDLATHRCTAFRHPNTGRTVPWELLVGNEFVFKDVSAVATFNDVEAEVAAVRAGIGIGQLPDYLVANELSGGGLVTLLPQCATSRLGVFMYYSERERIPARVRQFIDFVMDWPDFPFDRRTTFPSSSSPACQEKPR